MYSRRRTMSPPISIQGGNSKSRNLSTPLTGKRQQSDFPGQGEVSPGASWLGPKKNLDIIWYHNQCKVSFPGVIFYRCYEMNYPEMRNANPINPTCSSKYGRKHHSFRYTPSKEWFRQGVYVVHETCMQRGIAVNARLGQ